MRKVSVVIPCRNEKKHIKECIDSIFASHYSDIEVIVADGMSDDGTREVLVELQKQYQALKVVNNPEKLTPYAFNYGVKNATGDFIQIIGSRNVLSPKYIPTLIKALDDHPEVGCVGGDYQHIYETPESRFISYAMESRFGVGSSNYRVQKEDCFVDTVGIPMYRRNIFDQFGYFDEQLTRNQDDEFNYRLRKAGVKIMYVHAAKATYLVRDSFKKCFKQYFQYGYFKVFVNKKHRAVTTLRQLVPAAFVAFIAMGAALCMIEDDFIGIYLSVLALYIVLGVFVAPPEGLSFTERLKVFKAILTLHIAYGCGYLRGLFDFLLLNRSPSQGLQKQTV